MAGSFSRLKVSGYRRLRELDLELRPLNVLIGANGVGKSSVLAALDLLAATAEGSLETTISDDGGISSLLTADGRTKALEFALEMPIDGQQPIRYDLGIMSVGNGYAIADERLSQKQKLHAKNPFFFVNSHGSEIRYHDPISKQLVIPNWEHKYLETALFQVPKMYQMPEKFRQVLASCSTIYHTLDVSHRAPIRLPQPFQPAETPAIDGSLLLPCLHTLQTTNVDRYAAIEDSLRAAFSTFESLTLPAAAAGNLTLAWKDRAFSKPIFPHQLSEGTLRFLWLVTLLQCPKLPSVLLIDEPEVSLHPEMLRLLAELMREASSRTQLIVATHSDRLVRFLRPDELVICDLADHGGMTVKRGDDLDLDSWLEDYTLDQLWSMGRLGGRS